VAELRTVTIIGLYRPDSPELPKWAADYFLTTPKSGTDFLIACKEWLPGVDNQMRVFQKHAGHEFLLTAPQHPDVGVRLSGLDQSAGDGSFQAYGAQVIAEDRVKLVPRIAYRIQPINTSDTYHWVTAPDLAPLTLKE
jgi:hypothetical protein